MTRLDVALHVLPDPQQTGRVNRPVFSIHSRTRSSAGQRRNEPKGFQIFSTPRGFSFIGFTMRRRALVVRGISHTEEKFRMTFYDNRRNPETA